MRLMYLFEKLPSVRHVDKFKGYVKVESSHLSVWRKKNKTNKTTKQTKTNKQQKTLSQKANVIEELHQSLCRQCNEEKLGAYYSTFLLELYDV